jgi:hypothetical protein
VPRFAAIRRRMPRGLMREFDRLMRSLIWFCEFLRDSLAHLALEHGRGFIVHAGRRVASANWSEPHIDDAFDKVCGALQRRDG